MTLSKKLFTVLILLAFACIRPAQAADDMNLIRDEEIEQSLKTMSKPVFDQAGLSADTVKFVLVDNNELNAFVAGGQNIFLHTGLILETQNPEELIGVIAHETGHIADGHLFRGQSDMSNLSLEAMLANILGVAVAIGAHAPDAGAAIGSAGNSLLLRTALRHTRTQEGSADRAGVRFLQGAGLPVTGFLSFMKKLGSQELIPESEQSEYVQTHPLTQDRIDALQHAVDEGRPGKVPPEWVELHRRMKAKLLGYLFPDRSLQDKDTSVAAQYGHAIAWFRKGQIGKSLAILDPLLKAEPQNAYFHETKGQILMENGRIEEAIASYAQATALAPSSGLIRIAYAHSLLEARGQNKERLLEAVKQLTFAINHEKHASEPHHMLGIAYGKLGEEGLSRLHLAEEAMMQNKPDFARREANLAKKFLTKGTPAYQRMLDILDDLDRKEKKPEKKD
jgi:predicted Zn-dependent protease